MRGPCLSPADSALLNEVGPQSVPCLSPARGPLHAGHACPLRTLLSPINSCPPVSCLSPIAIHACPQQSQQPCLSPAPTACPQTACLSPAPTACPQTAQCLSPINMSPINTACPQVLSPSAFNAWLPSLALTLPSPVTRTLGPVRLLPFRL
jgi:hypothetical protein